MFCSLFTLRARADYRLHRKEQLGYLHEVGENSLDMKDINGPLDEDMHKMQSARTVFKAKGPVQITQKLHQQVRKTWPVGHGVRISFHFKLHHSAGHCECNSGPST